ncbi:MAG: hypothetical protein R2876_06270 [Eubacteriales bacterium]
MTGSKNVITSTKNMVFICHAFLVYTKIVLRQYNIYFFAGMKKLASGASEYAPFILKGQTDFIRPVFLN